MTNGHIDEAERDALLTSDRRAIDNLLLTAMQELQTVVGEIRGEVSAMREVCETRGLMCPGMRANLADPVTEPPAASVARDREHWLMWTVNTGALKGIVLPLAVAIVVVVVSRLL